MQVNTDKLNVYAGGLPQGTTKAQAAEYQANYDALKSRIEFINQSLSPYQGYSLFTRDSLTAQYKGFGCIDSIKVYGDIKDANTIGISIVTPGGKTVLGFSLETKDSYIQMLVKALGQHPANSLYAIAKGKSRELLEKEYNMHRVKSGKYLIGTEIRKLQTI